MSKLIDLTGNRYSRLLVLHKDNERKTNSGSYWICECNCGNIKSVKSSSLRRGEIQSCGCLFTEAIRRTGQAHLDDLTGKRFGLLTVIERDQEKEKSYNNVVYWKCLCDCGNVISVRANNLRRKDENRTISCGCSKRSAGELYIANILDEANISYIQEYRFPDFPTKPFDFAIIKNGQIVQLIEFDGEQHYKEVPQWRTTLKEIQRRDKEKNEYAAKHNIPLIRIPYWERDNLTLDKLIIQSK